MSNTSRFSVGDVVHHKMFDYRGVVIDVDPLFMLTDEWYESVAKSRPPKDEPWYHVLVDRTTQNTYVAERNLELDDSGEPVMHPLLDSRFDRFEGGRYISSAKSN
ncbi:MAG: heat shock protein HspQ [Woeseia sp.]